MLHGTNTCIHSSASLKTASDHASVDVLLPQTLQPLHRAACALLAAVDVPPAGNDRFMLERTSSRIMIS